MDANVIPFRNVHKKGYANHGDDHDMFNRSFDEFRAPYIFVL